MKATSPAVLSRSRRLPTQARSRQRVERILEAAADVFADTGYEAATTEAIAARAGTSIGSLYQFFPNKRAMFDALGNQYLDRARVLFDVLLAEAHDKPLDELIDQAIDAFYVLQESEPAFRAVWKNWLHTPEFMLAGQALNREFAKLVETFLERRMILSARGERSLVATILVEVISAMLLVASQVGRPVGPKMIAETKVLVHRYLAPLSAAKKSTKPVKRKKNR